MLFFTFMNETVKGYNKKILTRGEEIWRQWTMLRGKRLLFCAVSLLWNAGSLSRSECKPTTHHHHRLRSASRVGPSLVNQPCEPYQSQRVLRSERASEQAICCPFFDRIDARRNEKSQLSGCIFVFGFCKYTISDGVLYSQSTFGIRGVCMCVWGGHSGYLIPRLWGDLSGQES